MGNSRKRRFSRWVGEFLVAAIAGPTVGVLSEIWYPVFQNQMLVILGIAVGASILALAILLIYRRLGDEISPAHAAGTFLLLSPAVIVIIAMTVDKMIVLWLACAIVACGGIFSIARLVNRIDDPRLVKSAAPAPDAPPGSY